MTHGCWSAVFPSSFSLSAKRCNIDPLKKREILIRLLRSAEYVILLLFDRGYNLLSLQKISLIYV